MSMKPDRVELTSTKMLDIGRPADADLRILIFTATYFVLDGVTLTIRRLESHLRSRGATVKICSTVPDNLDPQQTKDIIIVPGIKIPFNHAGDYSFGVGLDDNTIAQIEEYNPTVVHFTVPDFVGLDGIRWCQRKNVAYIGTWHSNYCDYLKYYFLEWILAPGLNRYLKGFFEQIPTIYVPTAYVCDNHETADLAVDLLNLYLLSFACSPSASVSSACRCCARCMTNGVTVPCPNSRSGGVGWT
jgi:hypothetical protein